MRSDHGTSAVLLAAAVLAPAWLPILPIAAVLEGMVDWRWHVPFTGAATVALAVAIFRRFPPEAVVPRALAVANVGLAADMALSALLGAVWPSVPNGFLPCTASFPLAYALHAWLGRIDPGTAWSRCRGTAAAVARTGLLFVLLFVPFWFSFPLVAEREGRGTFAVLDSADVIQVLRHRVPFYRWDERKFLRHLLQSRYLLGDPRRIAGLERASALRQIMTLGRNPADRWSNLEPVPVFGFPHADRRVGIGVIDANPLADGDLVLQVSPGSPAAAAGLSRGDKLVSINRIPVRRAEPGSFRQIPAGVPLIVQVVHRDQTVEDVAVARAPFDVPVVAASRTLDVAGYRVAYLQYDSFSPAGAVSLRHAGRRLGEEHPDVAVLDLRYNGGGTVEEIGILAGMLAPTSAFRQTAILMTSRNLRNDPVLVSGEEPRLVADPRRLYVITSDKTCSAAESLIMALRPFMEVITIGGRTCGKPYGFRVEVFDDKVFSVVTFRVANSRGEATPATGIAPTCEARDDPGYRLGDVREASLAEALYHLAHGHCSDGAGVSVIRADAAGRRDDP